MVSSGIVTTGTSVAPGDVLFSCACQAATGRSATSSEQDGVGEDVVAADGCYVRIVSVAQEGDMSVPQRQVIASRLGVVQWEGSTVRVFSRPSLSRSNQSTNIAALGSSVDTAPSASVERGAATSAPSLGPRPGDTVHVRVVRVARLFVVGEIIAIGGTWCSTGSSSLNVAASGSMSSTAFRGVLRVEDIRPFRPTKDQLQPPSPSASYQPGDVVLAEVISQSDARQYQLSTCAPHCGVVESYLGDSEGGQGAGRVKLQVVPGRREVMVNPVDGSVVPRWCPLVELPASPGPAKVRRL